MSETNPNPDAWEQPVAAEDTGAVERDPITHDLKTWPEYFEAVQSGAKTFEIRVADRDFRKRDILLLREYIPEKQSQSWISYYRQNGWDLLGDDSTSDAARMAEWRKECVTEGYYTGRKMRKRVKYILAKDVEYRGKDAVVMALADLAQGGE